MSEVTVTVLLFAKARELVGSPSVSSSVPTTRYQELVSHLESQLPVLKRLNRTFVLSLNENYLEDQQEIVLSTGDEIAVIPPISGG